MKCAPYVQVTFRNNWSTFQVGARNRCGGAWQSSHTACSCLFEWRAVNFFTRETVVYACPGKTRKAAPKGEINVGLYVSPSKTDTGNHVSHA
jgi:hypothetical protein